MQLGFVIDHSSCIGCHACTVACKSENEVPVGSFRTWVKYTESGAFPEVRRSFAVLRCNQCTAAPCVTICPTVALSKGENGIVDVDPDRCIGCKSCMQACPYDALYINDDLGTAQKCHFCAHRTEVGLAPACAVVCPTEAIIPGDFHDPESVVSKMRASGELTARKTEAGTGPNVWYRDVAKPGVDPSFTNSSGGYIWSDRAPSVSANAEAWEAIERKARGEASLARTVYDVAHPPMWGWKVSAYLFTKSIAAGAFLVLLMFIGSWIPSGGAAIPTAFFDWCLGVALASLGLTTVLLVGDLKRPERFLYILLKPNWSSWLTRGAVVLMGFGLLLTIWLTARIGLISIGSGALDVMLLVTAAFAAMTAMYTAWLFGQAKGRVLWMRRGLAPHLLVQAWVAGCAFGLLAWPFVDMPDAMLTSLRVGLGIGLVLHGVFVLTEGRMGPRGRAKEYARVIHYLEKGPLARRRMTWTLAVGIATPLFGLIITTQPVTWMIISVMVLAGLFNEEDLLVRAGQALPIS